jgi:hypothetical protein
MGGMHMADSDNPTPIVDKANLDLSSPPRKPSWKARANQWTKRTLMALGALFAFIIFLAIVTPDVDENGNPIAENAEPTTSKSNGNTPDLRDNPPPPDEAAAQDSTLSVNPDEACTQLEADLKQLFEEAFEDQKIRVLEVNHVSKDSTIRDDGTVSCAGSLITSRGTVVVSYGTELTPKGQTLVTYHVNEALTNMVNP